MLLLTYLIYQKINEETQDPQVDESTLDDAFVFLGYLFFWPWPVLTLSKYLENQRHKSIWLVSFFSLALLTAVISIGTYLFIGLLLGVARFVGYDYYARKISLAEKEESSS